MRATALCIVSACGFSPTLSGRDASIDAADAYVPDAYVPDALPADLVAWYPMDDLSLHDATGRGHDGTCAACPTQTDGVIDHALAFTNARVDVAGAPDLETPEGTVAAWIAFDATSGGYACPFGTIFNQPANANTWQLCLFQSSLWQVFVQTTTGPTSFMAPAQITLGAWQHVAVVWTTSKVELFVGGVSQSSLATSPLVFDGNILTIGADRNSPNSIDVAITGKLDDLKLFRRALSQPELAALAAR